MRREFAVDKPVRRAIVSLCGLGQHELHLNGRKVGDGVMEPGWTNYRKRCLYATYDVTDRIVQGRNAVGVMLGNGMYNVVGGRYVKFTGSMGPPKMIAQVRLDYADGTSETIGSDATWKAARGPITFSCIYGGEDYDARRELPGWDQPDFADADWQAAAEVDGPGGALRAQTLPIKVMQTFKPAKITRLEPGVHVVDLGQNFSGWPRITVSGPAGATVRLVPGELLDDKGRVTQASSGGPVLVQLHAPRRGPGNLVAAIQLLRLPLRSGRGGHARRRPGRRYGRRRRQAGSGGHRGPVHASRGRAGRAVLLLQRPVEPHPRLHRHGDPQQPAKRADGLPPPREARLARGEPLARAGDHVQLRRAAVVREDIATT